MLEHSEEFAIQRNTIDLADDAHSRIIQSCSISHPTNVPLRGAGGQQLDVLQIRSEQHNFRTLGAWLLALSAALAGIAIARPDPICARLPPDPLG